MNLYKQGFKENIIDTVFRTISKVWLKITAAYSIYMFTIVVSMVILLKGILGLDLSYLENMQNPEVLQQMIENFDLSFLTPGFIFILLIVLIIISLVATWNFFFSLILTNDQINNDRVNFMETFNKSINISVIHLFGIGMLMYLIMIIGGLLIAKSSVFSGKFAVILSIGFMIGFFKLILVVPAFVIGRKSLKESFLYSVTIITWLRALKLFGAFILFILVFLVAALVVSLVSMIFAIIPVLGQLIQLGIQVFFGSFLVAFSVSVLVGLYYRYIDQSNDEEGVVEV